MVLKILVIDDDLSILRAFSRQLRLDGHTVLTAQDGLKGVDFYVQEQPDLVFSDVRMPALDGFGVLEAIHERDPDAEIVLITGHGDMDMAIEALRAGASDFLPKPIDHIMLAKVLQRVIDRVQLREELCFAQEELAAYTTQLEQRVTERTQALVQANAQLRELDRLKGKFIHDISHELRTPMTNVVLLLELFENSKSTKRDFYLGKLREQIFHLKDMVEAILNFTDSTINQPLAAFAPVNLNRIISDVVTKQCARTEAAGLELTFHAGVNVPLIYGNASQLIQLVIEILDNAIKYTEQGHIYVYTDLDKDPGKVLLTIKDTGRGISSDDMPYVFNRFYRGKNVGSFNTPGAGLGLTMVKEIVRMHSGDIAIESQVDVGTTVKVWFLLHGPQTGLTIDDTLLVYCEEEQADASKMDVSNLDVPQMDAF